MKTSHSKHEKTFVFYASDTISILINPGQEGALNVLY